MNRGEDLIELRRTGKRPDVPIVMIGDRRLSERYERQGFYVVDWRTMGRLCLPALRGLSVWICHTPDRTEEAQRLVTLVLAEDPLNLCIVPHEEWFPWKPHEAQVLIAAGKPAAVIEEQSIALLRERFEQADAAIGRVFPEITTKERRSFAWRFSSWGWL